MTFAVYPLLSYLPAPAGAWLDELLAAARVYLIEHGIIAGSDAGAGGAESPVVSAARGQLEAARSSLDGCRADLERHRVDAEHECGPADVFRPLRDTCIEAASGEYSYEVCFMASATQKPRKGGSDVSLGSFAGFERVRVDEPAARGHDADVGHDGDADADADRDRLVMKFANGQPCWNGPARSTTVVMFCAEHEQVWKVVEEEKCVYRIEIGTAAVCEPEGESEAGDGTGHPTRDEL